MATSKTINAAIDRINKRKTPGKRVALVSARNPVKETVTVRGKQLPNFPYLVQIEGTHGDGDWFSEAAFRLLSRAEEYAHFLHKKMPRATIRVLMRD